MTPFLAKPALFLGCDLISFLVFEVDVVVLVLSQVNPQRLLWPMGRRPESCCQFDDIFRKNNCRTYKSQDLHSHFPLSLGGQGKKLKGWRGPHRSSFMCHCEHRYLIVGTTLHVTNGINTLSQRKGSAYPKSL